MKSAEFTPPHARRAVCEAGGCVLVDNTHNVIQAIWEMYSYSGIRLFSGGVSLA